MITLHTYSDQILRDISFSVDEDLIILGANGAGKSSLAKLLCGLTPSNSVEVNGKKLETLSAKERAKKLNYIPAKLDIFDEYISVEEYLELSLLYSKLSVGDGLKSLEIQHLKNKTCKTLSSGEEQLTMLCSALLHNANITIFDEPTANLDPKKTKQVFHFLQESAFKQKIIITHDLNIAYRLGYKILYMEAGQIKFFGKNQEFFGENNLKKFFGKTLVKVDDYFMVNL